MTTVYLEKCKVCGRFIFDGSEVIIDEFSYRDCPIAYTSEKVCKVCKDKYKMYLPFYRELQHYENSLDGERG